MNAPFKTDALPEWRLDDLYAGRDDPKIEADLTEATTINGKLAAMKGQFVEARADAAQLGEKLDQGIQLYEDAVNAMWGIGAYASMSASTQRDDPAWAKFEADLRARSSQIAAESLFFTLEINELEDAELDAAIAANAGLQRWKPWLRRVRAGRPHELSADLERLLIDKAPAAANWSRLFDETLAKLSAKVDGDTLTLPELLNATSGPNPKKRKAAAKALGAALEERGSTIALCLNTLAYEKQVEDRWRKYDNPAHGRHLANEVDADAVQALDEAVAEGHAAISHRYYRLKAKILGVKQLNHWDRNSPLDTAQPRVFSWDEAKAITLESFADLAPRFADAGQVFFDNPWIDARPRPGKQSGAYCHPVTANRHPYVFMNYLGERRDVLTLAHELGHAVHNTLAHPQGTLLADTPLTLAETASIFGEGLVFERLLAGASKSERRGLLAGKIEDGINTVVRQMAFHRFETRFHDARRVGEVSTDELGKIWLEVMGDSLGPAVKLNKGYEHFWSYVSHFVHAPFYVYAYAFGDLLVRALMEKRREDPQGFAPLYEQLLAAGGAKTYVEALAPFGLNPREKAFWASGVKQLERLVDEFEALV